MKPATLDEYLDALPPERRVTFTEVLRLIRQDLPGWEEVFAYGMPGFQSGEKMVGMAAQKNYFAFYFCGPPGFLDPWRERLHKLDLGKGCIRFKKPEDLPAEVLAEILQAVEAL